MIIIYAIVLGIFGGILAQLFAPTEDNNNLFNWMENIISGGVVGFLVMYYHGYEPLYLIVAGMSGSTILQWLASEYKYDTMHVIRHLRHP